MITSKKELMQTGAWGLGHIPLRGLVPSPTSEVYGVRRGRVARRVRRYLRRHWWTVCVSNGPAEFSGFDVLPSAERRA